MKKPFDQMVLRGILKDRQGRILLMQRSSRSKGWPGRWEFPGGKMDEGETVDMALRREFREETGLDIRVGRFVDACAWERAEGRILYLIYRVISRRYRVVKSDEHDDLGWFTLKQIRKLDVSPSLVKTVEAMCA